MIVYGTGGHAKVVAAALNDQVDLFFDDNPKESTFRDVEVKRYAPDILHETPLIIAIGDGLVREQVSRLIKHRAGSVIADSAVVHSSVQIGPGSQILQNALVQPDTVIDEHVIINSSASVDHDCRIGSFCHIAPNSTLCGDVTIGRQTLVGAGAVVLPGIEIGENCVVGAGAVVIDNVPDNSTVVGNPARVVKSQHDA